MSACVHCPLQKITRSESLFMTQWSHYQALFIHLSLSSSDQNRISHLGRLPHQRCHCVCAFVCTQAELDKQEQYDDAVNTSPSVRNAVSASAYEREILPYGVFFTDEALFSCRPCRYGWLSGMSDWMRRWTTLLFLSRYFFTSNHRFLVSPAVTLQVLSSWHELSGLTYSIFYNIQLIDSYYMVTVRGRLLLWKINHG